MRSQTASTYIGRGFWNELWNYLFIDNKKHFASSTHMISKRRTVALLTCYTVMLPNEIGEIQLQLTTLRVCDDVDP